MSSIPFWHGSSDAAALPASARRLPSPLVAAEVALGHPSIRPPSSGLAHFLSPRSPRLSSRSGPWPLDPNCSPGLAYLPFCSPRLLCWTGPCPSTPQAAQRLATVPSCSRQPQANQQERPLAVLSQTTAPGWHTYLSL
ncbi:Hypp419 [Branchiostoma lanceolatum]|uniref:Hypp419 protein n=1 Tax=Branchiostoma lanceolatum TaxID=7740 RepID=A0A8J9YNN6_BRALA|nr:Hypp419 [Branchiostoma lanceolatum]